MGPNDNTQLPHTHADFPDRRSVDSSFGIFDPGGGSSVRVVLIGPACDAP